MPRAKQGFILGTEPPSIPALDRLADKYLEARDARMAMLKTEVDLKDKLLAKMKEANLSVYEYGSHVVTVDSTEKVHVRRSSESNGEE